MKLKAWFALLYSSFYHDPYKLHLRSVAYWVFHESCYTLGTEMRSFEVQIVVTLQGKEYRLRFEPFHLISSTSSIMVRRSWISRRIDDIVIEIVWSIHWKNSLSGLTRRQNDMGFKRWRKILGLTRIVSEVFNSYFFGFNSWDLSQESFHNMDEMLPLDWLGKWWKYYISSVNISYNEQIWISNPKKMFL